MKFKITKTEYEVFEVDTNKICYGLTERDREEVMEENGTDINKWREYFTYVDSEDEIFQRLNKDSYYKTNVELIESE